MTHPTNQSISTVLFDLGGVLAGDIFEHVLFDRRFGLAPRGWLARRRWKLAATALWQQAALSENTAESEFWSAFSQRVGSPLAPAAITVSERHAIRTNPEAAKLLAAMRSAGLRIGLISDNTAFWYPKQLAALGRTAFDPGLIFLSCEQRRTKATGLFELAATKVNPTTTLVIEDRPHLRRLARAAGFRVAGYRLATGRSLTATLRRQGINL